jgi:hypothetical protein
VAFLVESLILAARFVFQGRFGVRLIGARLEILSPRRLR